MTHPEGTYERQILYSCEAFEVVSCEWSMNSKSAIHQHGWSQCHVLVQEGVFENTNFMGFKQELSINEPGQVISTPVGSQHQIKCISEKGGRTLHVYVPPISDEIKNIQLSTPKSDDLKNKIDFKLSQAPLKWDQLQKVFSEIQKASISTHSELFMNQLFSGVLPEMLAAEQLLAQTKSTMATYEASPVFTLVEKEVVQQLGQLAGWPADRIEGVTVPGGSAANFMALHCARHKRFPNYKTQGLSAQTKVHVYVSEEAHYSFTKACVVLGFGSQSLIKIKSDASGCLLPQDLLAQVEKSLAEGFVPLMACATAGTTVAGAFDPIQKMSDICQQHGIWLHVDGAWGGPAMFSKTHKHLIQGLEKADSLTFDAHKLFGANLTCSFFLAHDPDILLAANDVSGAEYLFHGNNDMTDRGRLSWQCGRQADAMSFWTIWKSVGQEQLGQFVDRLMQVQSEVTTWIVQQKRLKLVYQPSYLNICVQIEPPTDWQGDRLLWSKHVREELKKQNKAFINYSTNSDGLTFLRLILSHPQIKTENIKQVLSWALELK